MANETVSDKIRAAHQGRTSLNLAYEELKELPVEIGRLTKLETLDLSGNQIVELPAELGQLKKLHTLLVRNNQLRELPVEIGQLIELETLDLSGNQLAEFPAEIIRLTQLQCLYLDSNRLTELPVKIGRLADLRELDLDGNQLVDLPAEIQNLAGLRRLSLHNNDALSIPPEVLGPTWQEVYRENPATPVNPAYILAYYFRSHTEAASLLLEAKLLILGQGAVGKTSLVKRFVDGDFNPQETKTDGIEINPWQISGKDGQEIRVNIWDFGGQEIMHATHQFFLTKRSLYVVVLDARKGENDNNIFYWLRIIESFGGDSPVLVVTNKCEGTNNLDLDERRLRKDYPSIQGFFETSCKTGYGIVELKMAIEEQIGNLGHVYDQVPRSFLDTKADLEKQTGSKDFLEVREYREICKKHEIVDGGEQDRLLRFLHDLGVVLHFEDSESLYRLEETKILNPQWVTNGVYKILNDPDLTEKGGALGVRDVNRILTTKAGYPKAARLFILGMMEKFELCYLGYQKPKRYLVPELLPKNEPDLDFDTSDALRFEYHYELLPEGVLPRFIVRMHPHLREELVWKRGALLEIDGNEALVRADIQAGRVFVAVFGESGGRRRALTAIRAEFRAIHRTIPGLRGEERVPLPRDAGRSVSYEHLLRLEELGMKDFLPEGARNQYSVSELLDGVESHEDRIERKIAHRLPEVAEELLKHRENASETDQQQMIEEAAEAAKEGDSRKTAGYLMWLYKEAKGGVENVTSQVLTSLIRGY